MIHKTAIIDNKAIIGKNVEIGAYSMVGPNVQINENTTIHSHVSISGNTIIGKNNKIYPFSSIGNDPQDLKFNGEETKLVIGDNNKIREYVSINPGTKGGRRETTIGNNCLLMVSSHVAHDCVLENNIVLANNVAIAGHAQIANDVIIGGNSAVQQFTRIGKMAMIGGMTGVEKDVIPYSLSAGNRNQLLGLNLVGLRRKKISNKVILLLSEAYKEIFKTQQLTENLNNLNSAYKDNSLINDIIEFINKEKKRPICTPLLKNENN
ncbi:acyl-ACP--UDP-N-acetylglucosamine O-acyltransferase [Candidatus Pelagibacter sp. Uisw_090]|uniref:acyl-ACP--UDP-N-acetylglucosamine O-acyltransferase n=1 Tax=Candidatus Pelagibacter sp. Uisw_090 TaxID=3230993 RepID=UPI0039E87730